MQCDVAIIGAGPAGLAAGILLRQMGYAVSVFERGDITRHKIGESLLPASMPILTRLGIGPDILNAYFQPKYGARFIDPTDNAAVRFLLLAPETSGPPSFQVQRAAFDTLLAAQARRAGCEIYENTAVHAADVHAPTPRLTLADGRAITCRFILDASGRAAHVAAHAHAVEKLPDLGRLAAYSYFRNLPPLDGVDADNISMVLLPAGWVWLIPLAGGETSVGMVLARPGLIGKDVGNPAALFYAALRDAPQLLAAVSAAQCVAPFRVAADYSFQTTRRRIGHCLLLGDAGGFLDPIFSSGVHLALESAQAAARAVHLLLHSADASALLHYEQTMAHKYAVFQAFVERFYQRDLVRRIFFASAGNRRMVNAIVEILSGYTDNPDNPMLALLGHRAVAPLPATPTPLRAEAI